MLKLCKSVVFILPGADYETIDNSMKAEILLVNIMSALGTFSCCLLRCTIDPLN